jgi:hypothetical protein
VEKIIIEENVYCGENVIKERMCIKVRMLRDCLSRKNIFDKFK